MKPAHTNSETLDCTQLSGAYRVAEGDVGGKGEEQNFGDEAEHEGRGHGMAVTSAGECSLSHAKSNVDAARGGARGKSTVRHC